ncbi:uncharacterized protein EAF01_004384 [Botrytis porri]|uniref:uncharacterized protein n=1 Tax=Botrytis porri TaxID=87229 RepID=UPI0018FF52E2|nr:uncharacterized protein EAF01_004384 [Botrytis porri]KAF7908629.1 hypothetical protein EAF01_004384 [Botrytis porri]
MLGGDQGFICSQLEGVGEKKKEKKEEGRKEKQGREFLIPLLVRIYITPHHTSSQHTTAQHSTTQHRHERWVQNVPSDKINII